MVKRPKLNILITLVLTIILLVSLTNILDHIYKRNANHKYSKILNHIIDPNVMIFGSSVAYVHFNSNLIQSKSGRSVFNAGIDGTFYQQYNGVMNEFLSYTKECETIVLALTYNSFEKRNLITRHDQYLAYLNNPNIKRSLRSIDWTKVFFSNYLPGYKLTLMNRNYYRVVFKKLFSSKIKPDSLNGYKPVNQYWEPKSDYIAKLSCVVDERIIKTFNNFLLESGNKGIRVIIILPPIYIEGKKFIEGFDKLQNLLSEMDSSYGHVDYYDYSDSTLCINKSLFYNYSHLNSSGADIFSSSISELLIK